MSFLTFWQFSYFQYFGSAGLVPFGCLLAPFRFLLVPFGCLLDPFRCHLAHFYLLHFSHFPILRYFHVFWYVHTYRNEIYDIGTEIRTWSRFFTNIIESFYKSIIPQEIKSARHSPSSGSVKTRFKAIFKKWPSWIRSLSESTFLSSQNQSSL